MLCLQWSDHVGCYRKHAAVTGVFSYKGESNRTLGGCVLTEARDWDFYENFAPREVRQDAKLGHLLHFCVEEGIVCDKTPA